MTYDGIILAAVIAEIRKAIVGARVQKIRQHNETDITLELRAIGQSYMLFLSADARFPRLHLTASSGTVPEQALNFCMLMRKHLDGLFIERIDQIGMDRVVHIIFRQHGSDPITLIVEIMGKHSNLILIDSSNKILGAIKHIGTTVSRTRQILPGRPYVPAPVTEKIDVRSLDEASFSALWQTKDEQEETKNWLVRTFSGFGPFMADEICARSTQQSPEQLRDELLQLRDMLLSSAFQPVLITNERGQAQLVSTMPSAQFPHSQQHTRSSVNEALDTLFRTVVTKSSLEETRTQVLTAIRRAAAAKRQTLKSIERTTAESERADTYRQIGELIMASLHCVEKGAKSTRLVNYFDTDMPELEIELDEKRSPIENAQRYFKRYQKARDAAVTARSRHASTLNELGQLTTAERDAESTTEEDALVSLRKMLTDQGLLRTHVAYAKAAEEFAGYRIRRHETSDGWEILHGENALSNDYLTSRVAKPNDIWLHARSVTGSHVVIRTAGRGGQVPRPVLIQAAQIAAKNSDAKHSSLVSVDHTLRKYVRKPRGSAPGLVTYRNEKTIDISPTSTL